MSRISLDNYEAWFLDFFEGRLDAAQIDELFQFLERNPKLKAELKDFEIIPIQPEPTPFDEKSFLKGEENELLEDPNLKLSPNQNIKFESKHLLKKPEVIEEDVFALAEGTITGLQAEELKSIIVKDNTLYHSFLAYQNARLVPDKSIVYPHKAQLKKGAAIIPLFMRYASAAAVITGLAVSVWWYGQSNESTPVAVEIPADKTNDSHIIENHSSSIQLAKVETETPVSTDKNIEVESSNSTVKSEKPITPQKSIKTIPADIPDEKPNDLAIEEKTIKDSYKIELQHIEEINSTNELNQVDDLAENTTPAESDVSLESSPETPTQKIPVKSSSDISKALGYFAKTATEKITEASGDRVALQRKKSSEGEILTSTFKLGAFEVSRSRSAK
jgi:hypothetical protein